MVKLGVNIDHVATIRQARFTKYPDIIGAAGIVEDAGADGITVHLREDRRHIQDKDVYLLRKKIKTRLNLEMAVSEPIVKIALKVKPDSSCLVPEKRRELTTEGGLDVYGQKSKVKKVVKRLKKKGIIVSLFIDPEEKQVKAAKEVGADYVELHTGLYAAAKTKDQHKDELERVQQAAKMARKLSLGVNAGHDLTYRNVVPIAAIDDIEELNIGHNIVARAVFVGLEQAVREMIALVRRPAAS